MALLNMYIIPIAMHAKSPKRPIEHSTQNRVILGSLTYEHVLRKTLQTEPAQRF